jgi:2-iminobutanoate/2-iminopropanoate deaminase
MPIERINPPTLHSGNSGYYHVLKDGDTVYVSGQAGVDKDRNLADTPAGQIEQTFKNLQYALTAGGSDMRHIRKMTVYLTHAEDIPTYREIRAKFIEEEFGATATLVLVAALPNPKIRIEIDLIAATA